MIPPIDKSFADRVYDEPPASMTTIAPEQFVIPGIMPMPDFSKPRDAWLALAFKDGKHLARCVQDGDYQRVDPATSFSSKFPPVIFLTGTNDTFIDPKFSKKAHAQLSELGVETKLVLAEGGEHGYNFGMAGDDPAFKSTVLPAFEFLRSHV
jgi:acetyl esterase/lipase